MPFTFTRLVCTLRLTADSRAPDPLLRLKGIFSDEFRAACGCREGACPGCRDGSCPWHRTFARELSTDPAALKRFQKPSLPFVFHLPPVPPPLRRGTDLPLGLVLAGTAVAYLPLYLTALRRSLVRLSDAGFAVQLAAVDTLDAAGRATALGTGADRPPGPPVLLTPEDLQAGRDLAAERVTVVVDTPLRIVRDGRPLRDLDFSDLARGLLRRLSSLAYYYADTELPLDYRWLAQRSAAVATLDARLHWDERPAGWGGLVGSIDFGGELGEFLPLLLLGELFHLGKGASWGGGSFRTSL